MTKFYSVFTVLILAALSAFGQSYINPQEGHKVAYFFSDMDHIQTLNVGTEFFYFSDGDTIYQADPDQQLLSTDLVYRKIITWSHSPVFFVCHPMSQQSGQDLPTWIM